MRLSQLGALSVALACSGNAPEHAVPDQSPRGWAALVESAAPESRARADELERSRLSGGILLTFWLRRDSVPTDTSGLLIGEHPCGMTVTRAWSTMPRNHPLAEPDPVVEFDTTGRPVARWLIPPDTRIVGVQEREILVADIVASGEPRIYLAIAPSDSFHVLPAIPVDTGIPRSCPALVEFEESEFTTCRSFHDAQSGVLRHLAFQHPCT